MKKIALVGSPNVGKSAIFNCLTGKYVTVSNYPGTTVDVSRGYFKVNSAKYEVIDTPGIYSLDALTDEERVTRYLLETENPDIVVHVIDAKNIRRMLNLTFELIDAGLNVILNLNIIDEAEKLGINIDIPKLSLGLGIPVVATLAARKKGITHLKKIINEYSHQKANIKNMANTASYGKLKPPPRLSGQLAPDYTAKAAKIAIERQVKINEILTGVFTVTPKKKCISEKFSQWLGKLTREPSTGIPILILVLYLGLYQFVGKFGAGYLVDYINNVVFGNYLNPLVGIAVKKYIPWEILQTLLVGEYGIFTMGLRYALAIILPIAGTFFLAFAVLEDSGYLPRLAMLADWLFKKLGLNGRAVIPISLGLGCGTMAIMVSRTLETRRERRLAVFLLALAVPCSAQLGIIMALLSHNRVMLALWAGYVLLIFFLAGWLSNKLLPGSHSAFYMEIPPLRMPVAINIIKKAYTRMFCYFIEIFPVFIIISVILWASDALGLFNELAALVAPLLQVLSLPPESAQPFILGFFRRDYGAAGLYDLVLTGSLSDGELLIAATALTLFVPCIAQLAVMVKEEGKIAAAVILALVLFIAFGAAFLMSILLELKFFLPVL